MEERLFDEESFGQELRKAIAPNVSLASDMVRRICMTEMDGPKVVGANENDRQTQPQAEQNDPLSAGEFGWYAPNDVKSRGQDCQGRKLCQNA